MSRSDRVGRAGAFGAVPRKRFGQHFLVDRAVVDAILLAVEPRPGDPLVEIGPGTGALTGALLARAGWLAAIEIDRDLAPKLAARYGSGLHVVARDVLTVDFDALRGELAQRRRPAQVNVTDATEAAIATHAATATAADDVRLRLVGNLPYNISTPLLFHLAAFTAGVKDQHFMLQKEVIGRIVAEPGGDMGRLTTVMQNLYRVERLFDVPPEAFDPPPKVQSSVVRMLPRAAPLTAQGALLATLLGSAFSQRRKMLRNTLGRWLVDNRPGFDPAEAAARDARLAPFTDPTRRAEEIPVAAWCALADELASAS